MNKFFASLIIATSIFVYTAPAQRARRPAVKPTPAAAAVAVTEQQTRPDYLIPFVNKTLANGLEVIVYPDSGVPLVTVEMAARNGSFTEPPELNGLSHLFEHMVFKPNWARQLLFCQQAESRGPLSDYGQRICAEAKNLKTTIGDLSYLNDIDQLGLSYNGTTREEVVNYYYTTTSSNTEVAIRNIRDAVRFPVFDEDELRREIEVVVGEIDRNESNPFQYLTRTMSDKLFYKYPSRKNPGGSRETVRAATPDKMRLIQSRYYVPNNMALVVTGDVNAEAVFAMAERYFGDWKKREVDPFKEFPLVEHPPLPKSESHIVEQPIQNIFGQIGWHGPSIGKDDAATYAADVFSYIITQPDSRFQRNLVDSGLLLGVDLTYYTQRNVGPITLTFVTTPDKAKAALRAIYAEVAAFDSPDYYTDTELVNAKMMLESRDLFEREKLSEYAHTLSFWWSSTGIEYFRGYHRALRASSRDDINKYIRTYIKNKPHVTVALMSPQSSRQASLTENDLLGK